MQKPTDSEWTHLLTGVSGQADDLCHRLLHRAKRLTLIENKVLDAVPHPEREHCSLANIRPTEAGYELILNVNSAAWASRLRFHDATIRESLSTNDTRFSSIKLVVEQPSAEAKPEPVVLTRSAKGAKALSSTADLIDDQTLADALRKLARTIKPD